MLDFLRSEGIDEEMLARIEDFRRSFPAAPESAGRIPCPKYKYYGRAVWREAIAAVLAGERNTLGHALVNDIVRHLSQTVDVGLAGAVVATFHGVIEKAIYRVAVVLVVLSSVDTTLCGDRVGTARRVLDAEVEHVETHLAERSGCAGASQTSTYDDDVKFKFILGVYQALMSLVVGPLLSYGTLRYSGI